MRLHHLTILSVILLSSFCVMGQVPEKVSYQASIRNTDNTVVSNTRIAVKIVILQNSFSGNSVYEEAHRPMTSPNGIINFKIGDGTALRGDFSTIDWSKGPYFIETLVDINGGGSYKSLGSTQLVSVPYALHAKTAEYVSNANYVSKAKVISFTNSRNAVADDIGNIIECTTDATLTLVENFNDMNVGDVINIEAHNGAILRVETDGQVQLNYTVHNSAVFESTTGNVRFGLLRKIDTNSYIISGQ